jgi:hypothetical protein
MWTLYSKMQGWRAGIYVTIQQVVHFLIFLCGPRVVCGLIVCEGYIPKSPLARGSFRAYSGYVP